MPSLLIIDDEPNARETLRSMLANCCPDIRVVGEANGVSAGLKAIRALKPEIVFLDIQMNDGTGFDLLNQLTEPNFKLVFATAYDEHALKAFRYNAIDYLLKPIDADQLEMAIGKVLKQTVPNLNSQLASLFDSLKGKTHQKLALSSQTDITYIQLDEILYLKSEGNYTTFFLKDGSKQLVVKQMQEYEDILPAEDFFRIHQSYIVHAAHVRQFLREESRVVIHNGDQLPVAKRRRQEFLEWLKET